MKFPQPQSLPALQHGPKLTQAQYDQRVCALSKGYNDMTPDQERAMKKDTLNISIDYKLGQNFPADRREQLWEVQSKIDKRFAFNLVKAAITRPWDIFGGLSKPLVRGFSKVLDRDELKSFFDFTDDELNKFL